jgi:VWFA-related protein
MCLPRLLGVAGRPAGQGPAPSSRTARTQDQDQRPVIRTGINFVRVDVIVTDGDGNAVLDLKPEDFTVDEDGKLQKIDSFEPRQDRPARAGRGRQRRDPHPVDEEREAARPDVRLFVILLDDYHVRRGNDMAVRKPLIRSSRTSSRRPTWSR